MVEIHRCSAYYPKGYIQPKSNDVDEDYDDAYQEDTEVVVNYNVAEVEENPLENVHYRFVDDVDDEVFDLANLNRLNIYSTPSTNEWEFNDDDEGKYFFDEFSRYVCNILSLQTMKSRSIFRLNEKYRWHQKWFGRPKHRLLKPTINR